MSALAHTTALHHATRGRDRAGDLSTMPLVAVLCTTPRARAGACAVALALAAAVGRAPAVTGAAGLGAGEGGVATLRAHRGAARLRARGERAVARGRLVWVAHDVLGAAGADDELPGAAAAPAPVGADRDGAAAMHVGVDPAGAAAAAAAANARAASALAVPAALAVPLPRTDALDRVLAWHDALVVVREPDASAAVFERALASLAELGRPVAAMLPPSRIAVASASAGLRAPAEAVGAIAGLGLLDARPRRG